MKRKSNDDEISAADFLPARLTVPALREAAKRCQGCDLYKDATQTVFGQGDNKARACFVGEQPGDVEDKMGLPFVGPAGKLLMKALDAAEIDLDQVYFTNAVKHFKFQWVGKRRLHKKPRAREIKACLPWLTAEIAALKPLVVVCLGATAAQALLGPSFRLTHHRGEFIKSDIAPYVMATVHPASILRARDDQTRHQEMSLFIEELRKVNTLLQR